MISMSQEDDHQIKVIQCKKLFEGCELGENICVSSIKSYLHDTWSVVRKECYIQLKKLLNLSDSSKELVNTLVREFCDDCKSATTWQEIHGSLLGLSAVSSGIDSIQQQRIESVSLALLGHVSTPVREAARSCLFNIQKRVNDQHNFVFKLVFLINSMLKSSQLQSEPSTLALDGILGCLVDSFTEFPTLILQFDVPSFINSADSNMRINQPTIEFLETVKLCMLHGASSVRQKAGQVLIIVNTSLLYCDASGSRDFMRSDFAVALVDHIVYEVLIRSLSSSLVDDWRIQEVCLMVSEEVCRGLLTVSLLGLGGDSARCPSLPSSVTALVVFLKDSMCATLCHSSFEVRRMATQLQPLLARVAIVINSGECSLIAPVQPPSKAVQAERVGFDTSFTDLHTTSDEDNSLMSRNLLSCVNVVWLSELVKQNQHLLEAFPHRETCASSSIAQDVCGVLLSLDPLENWSLEVSGRLFEIENRSQFQKELRSAVAASIGADRTDHHNSLVARMLGNCGSILLLAESVLPSLEVAYCVADVSSAEEPQNQAVLSNDLVEALALLIAFLVSLLLRVGSFEVHTELCATILRTAKSFLTRCRRLLVGWAQHICHIRTLSETTVSKAINMNAALSNQSAVQISRGMSASQALSKCWDGLTQEDSRWQLCIPSITDPATNPLAHLTGDSAALLRSTEDEYHTMSKPCTPIHASFARNSLSLSLTTPLTATGGSKSSPRRLSHNDICAGIGATGYQSMNRWNCESVSPLLSCMGRVQLLDDGDAIHLSVVAAEWVVSLLLNSLWLDCRSFCKKVLFDSLFVFVGQIAVTELSAHFVWSVHLLRALAEALTIRNRSIADIRNLLVLLRATNCVVELLNKWHVTIFSAEWDSVRDSDLQETNSLVTESVLLISKACGYFATLHQKPAAHHSSQGVDSDQHNSEVPSGVLVAAECDNSCCESVADEFSDWDEDSLSGDETDRCTPDNLLGSAEFSVLDSLLCELHKLSRCSEALGHGFDQH